MAGMAVTQLERPVYGTAEVDRLLALKSGTAQRWIDGYRRDRRAYPPVVRDVPTGDGLVTWGEFIECRFLAQYRSAGVPLVRIRPVVQRLRDELGVRYPLAHKKLFVAGRELVEMVQREIDLEPELAIVVRTGQVVLANGAGDLHLGWAPLAQRFLDSVEWDDGGIDPVVARIRPSEKFPSVVIDPARSFGAPTVRGVRTEVIAEEVSAGDSPDLVARNYELSRGQVDDAVGFEQAA